MGARRTEAHLFIVFGGTGDLMRRKLLPALYRICRRNDLSDGFAILGVARSSDVDDDSYRAVGREALAAAGFSEDKGMASWCDDCLFYHSIGEQEASDFLDLKSRIESIESSRGLPGNRVLYLALSPVAFPSTIDRLGQTGLNRGPGWTRLVVEKPFGRDRDSAHALNATVHSYFEERQVYRIDHYLGKESVQNLLVFRFANPMFESVWNRDRVKSVQITVAESIGVGSRSGYYDRAGALRDMVQNHATQLLTLTAMEAPAAFDADAIRDEKVKVLRSMRSIRPEDVVFGQYGAGEQAGQAVVSYLDEQGVDPKSRTDTFVSLELAVDNWRWKGVPFYIRTGKRLSRRLTEIVVRFHEPPVSLFDRYAQCRLHSNALILTLQPDEGFAVRFDVKKPGQGMALSTHSLKFQYGDAFGPLPDGYETLLFDILNDDQTLFVRSDEVEASWSLYEPLLADRGVPDTYEPGTWGPASSHDLLARREDRWLVAM